MLSVEKYQDVVIGEGQVRIPGLFSLKVFLYYVDGLLIDTGPSRLSKAIKHFLHQYNPEQVSITHIHEDHCGVASWIRENFPNVPIYVHPLALEKAAKHPTIGFYRRIFWGMRKPFKARPYNGEYVNTDKHSFKVIHVGAHCPDHVVLYEERLGWLFTGDIFVTPYPRMGFIEENYTEHIKALENLIELDPKIIFCSHSGIHHEARKLLYDRLKYLAQIRNEVAKLRKKGFSDEKITKILFPQKSILIYLSKGQWSPYHIVRSL